MGYVAGGRIGTNSPDSDSGLAGVLNSSLGIELEAASGAIGIKEGTAVITKSSAAAVLTLALPTAGNPSAGGDDGKILNIVSTTAKAHTVTTPSNGISDGTSTTKDTATFAAYAGASFSLIAYAGEWYLLALNAVTLTEV